MKNYVKSLVSIAEQIEAKYAREFSEHSNSLFTLINRNSHLAEKIAREAMKLSDNLTDYEVHPEKFPKEKLAELEKELVVLLAALHNLNK